MVEEQTVQRQMMDQRRRRRGTQVLAGETMGQPTGTKTLLGD